jgi:hypothetical protein
MVVALVSIVIVTAMVMDLPASTATAIAALRWYGIGGVGVIGWPRHLPPRPNLPRRHFRL